MNEINRSPDLEMVVLKEISSAIVNERNGTALLRHILDVLYRRMKMLRGTFTIRRGNDLMIEASHGLDEQEMKRGHYHVGEGITGHVAETGRPHVIEDISRDSRFLNRTRTRKSGEKVAFICVPIIHLQQVIGTLSIDRAVDRDTDLERDQKLLEIVGNIVGDALAASLQAHEERAALVAENEKLRELLTTNPGELIGNCSTMLQVYEQIRQVAPSDATVLIRGSSGTGKELVARAVVNLSGRKDKPLVTLNCAAMPENLLESELFGHEKGSFTGATSRRIGRAEAADGGTLFLDEIGDLSLQMQVKLLRFLQEKTFSRVGSNRELHADVRFIAATSASRRSHTNTYIRLSSVPYRSTKPPGMSLMYTTRSTRWYRYVAIVSPLIGFTWHRPHGRTASTTSRPSPVRFTFFPWNVSPGIVAVAPAAVAAAVARARFCARSLSSCARNGVENVVLSVLLPFRTVS